YDGLKKRRLDRPYIRNGKGKLEEASWEDALALAANRLTKTPADKIAAVTGDLCAVEDLYAFKDLMGKLGVKGVDGCVGGLSVLSEARGDYLMNTGIAGIEAADAILMIGTNPRREAALVNARIRKVWREKRLPIGLIGEAVELTYPYEHLGDKPADIEELAKSKSAFAKSLKDAQNLVVILGAQSLKNKGGQAIHQAVLSLCEKLGAVKDGWNGFNMLHADASQVAALDMGLTGTADLAKAELVYLMNVDTDQVNDISKDAFVIYQGHHGGLGAHRADIILPGAAYTEKDALYVNTEGRVQMGKRAVFPVGEAREDWKILRALSENCGIRLGYNSQVELRRAIVSDYPAYGAVDVLPEGNSVSTSSKGKKEDKLPAKFGAGLSSFYQTNVIARASAIMAECAAQFEAKSTKKAAE
ncbi:MAG: molybdopterin-dependent oxidoreductase, partial [Pseudobdellovibrionaceae bacterium]